LKSPLSRKSFEPRFAIESYEYRALELGIELYVLTTGFPMTFIEYDAGNWNPDSWKSRMDAVRFTRYSDATSALLLGPAGTGPGNDGLDPIEIEGGASPEIVAAFSWKWLRQVAKYPKRPWFEGDEQPGFAMFNVPWLQPPSEQYGRLVIVPKWFEIHK
jgi:hypothetical protein